MLARKQQRSEEQCPIKLSEKAEHGFIQIYNLIKYFPRGNILTPKNLRYVKALNGITLSLTKGKIMGIVGESGCGKSTLGRLLVRADLPTQGEIIYEGENIRKLRGEKLLKFRQKVQYVFQDPYSSFNPRMKIRRSLSEPLSVIGLKNHVIKEKIDNIMDSISLSKELIDKYPSQLSGGQLQRFAIARVLLLNPEFIICDEVVSALDVSIQAQILNLLYQIQMEKNLSLLFISHDLNVIKFICDQVAVMYLGKIVEVGSTKDILENPIHPYTISLISSLPIPDPRKTRSMQNVLKGEVPSPINPPSGCKFRTRCPKVQDICAKEEPELKYSGERGTACLFV